MSDGVDDATVGELRNVLDAIDAEAPPALELADRLADATSVDAEEAHETVTDAIDAGVLVEEGEGFGGVRLAAEYRDAETPKTAKSGDIDARGAGSSGVDPQGKTGEDDLEARSLQAFAAAIDFFAAQLDRDISDAFDDAPDTPRDYYTGYRGWSEETISAKKLGYAPADDQALLDHLMREGFDGDAIQGTGLFYEDFTPHFQGRYVLPYFDADGRPVYAISRSLNDREDGHPRDPKGDQKYTKAIKTKDRTYVDEPIYGRETVDDDTDRLLVAGGIADAITLHETGEACISPVTTVRFKSKHEPVVVDLVDRHDLEGVYMLNDAERPSVDRTHLEDGETADAIGDVLTIKQYGEGERAAFGNAEFLLEEGVDPYLARLPGGDDDLRKLDPDDYVKESWGSVDALLRSARHAESHPAYTDWASRRREREVRKAVRTGDADGRSSSSDADGSSSAGGSGLWDLEFTDVSGMSVGDRQNNPLGHHGDSEGYFVCADKGGFVHGFDHKYAVAYNAVSYLLCDAGERRASDPNGPLSDWEVFVAWQHAKANRHLPDDDPVPYRALLEVALRDNLVDRDELVERDADEGDVVEDPDPSDDTYTALPPGTYDHVLEHVEDTYGVHPGRDPAGGAGDDEDDEEYRSDPREVSATVDPRRAWDAAGRVTPDQVDGLEAAPDTPERFATPSGEAVDVVRAVAIAEGLVDDAEAPLDDRYPEAYERARTLYDAPLPEYYTTSDAIAEFDAVLDVIGEATYWDLDTDALETTETARDDQVGGDAVRALNPAWRESDSGASVLVFESGTVWDADTERVLDVVRFAALDAGIVDEPGDALAGEDFTAAYAAARDRGAPLPRWEPASDGGRTVTAQLPDAEELVDTRDVDGVDPDTIDQARADVEELIDEVARDAETPSVVTALPATGKTTGTIKTADDRPTTYLAPRKELQAQALAKADRWGIDACVLPVFSDERVVDEVLASAEAHVREFGKDRLRDRWSVVANAVGNVDDVEAGDIFVEPDAEEDDVDLDRPTCPTADGEYGPAWALAVHVARSLGYTPQEIHTQARGLFGAELPCTEEGTCPYADGWETARDPDAPPDILVGSYVHAHVVSARTYFTRNARDGVDTAPRTVVTDEFPGEAFVREFGDIADDHATWLARSLRDDVEDRRDAYQADLAGDDWVNAWLRGEGDQVDAVDDALAAIGRTGDLLEARDAAGDILDEVDRETLDALEVLDPLEAVLRGDAREAYGDLGAAVDAVDPNQPGAGLITWIRPAVLEPLEAATDSGASEPSVDGVDPDALPVAGDLDALVARALKAAREGTEGARERLSAAAVALRGGERGCRRLAAWADDGYAHPDAHHLLAAIAAPSTGPDAPARIQTSAWAFDEAATEGTSLDVVDTGDKATTVLDRNGHGALLHTPPSRVAAGGGDVPLVGLDATGRAELWAVALGEPVETADIHDTPRERAQFLEDALDLRVIQAADRPRYYEGSPASKDTEGDVALLETLAEEYAGIDAPRERGAAPTRVGKPAAITTKGVRQVLEADDRLDDVVSAWENYGNVTGSNDLGKHRLGAILGCQHFGDDAVERFAALAGESVDTDRSRGRGDALGYGSELGDAYLAHMTEDQTTQAILRLARGDSGATVVARTSALGADLPVVGDAQVVKTWSDTATTVAREYRRLGRTFTTADVRDAVDVSDRHVRRVLVELVDAGYVRRVDASPGRATTYERVDEPGAGDVDLPARTAAVAADPGHSPTSEYYTWNVRVRGGDQAVTPADTAPSTIATRAPPAPDTIDGLGPPS